MSEVALTKSNLLKFLQGQGLAADFNRYVFLVKRRLWLVGLIVCVSTLAGIAWLLRQPKIYSSKAVVQIEQVEPKVLGSKVEDVQTTTLGAADYVETIVQSLTSNSVLIETARTLGLDKDPSLFPGVDKGVVYPETSIANKMRSQLHVALRKDTRLIDIVAEDVSPVRARDISAAVVQAYLHQNFEQQFKTSNQATLFLQDEAEKLKKKLEDSERQLQAYKEQHNAVSLESSEDIITEKLKEINNRTIEAKNNRIRLESDIELLRKIPPNDTGRMLQIGSVSAIQQVSEIRNQIVTAEANLAGLQKRYLPLHPKYIAAATEIQKLKQSLQDSLRDANNVLETQYAAAKDSEEKLNILLQQQEQAALELSKIAIPYNTLRREVESDKAMYDALNTRIRETSISQGVEKSPFHLVEEPLVGIHPVKPEYPQTLGIVFAVSLAVGLALIITMDSLDETLRSLDQAEEFLGIPALAVVPEESVKKGKRSLESAFQRPDSRQAEAFRTLRASLSLLGANEEARRVFMITSAVPGEGKSFSSLSLAQAFDLNGSKTAVIEGDMRRPSFYMAFPDVAERNTPGLTDVLSGNCQLDEALRQTSEENVTVLFAGRSAPNPAELLSGNALDKIVETLKERFDRIVIDTAPINAVSDTLVMISAAQYVCLIVRPARTAKRAIARAIHLIEKAQGTLAGFVLNRAKFNVGAYYYYYYYGDKYGYKAAKSAG